MEDFDKIYNIKYVDASYTYEKNIGKKKLSVHEAYGYVKKIEYNIIILFIKERKTIDEMLTDNSEIGMGIVIPDTALLSVVGNYKTDILDKITTGVNVEITWRDVTFVMNMAIYQCTTMYTEGLLYRISSDHIILRDPQTISVHPGPVNNLPGRGLPTYLVIPISFILDISVIERES